MVEIDRIKYLNDKEVLNRENVIYWMQSSQRVEYNHALEYAISSANEFGKDLIVYFGITENYPEANERHYYFMLEGLCEIKRELEKVNIRMIILKTSPEKGISKLLEYSAMIIVDKGLHEA
ncbi:MAG: deoxyribodipyrimidine photo-lyase [Proteocatella sp.]